MIDRISILAYAAALSFACGKPNGNTSGLAEPETAAADQRQADPPATAAPEPGAPADGQVLESRGVRLRLLEPTIRTEDGVDLAAIAVAPLQPTEWGAVVIHGISLNHAEPLNIAVCDMLARRDVLALSVDMRWHDGYDPSVVRNSNFEATVPDVRAAIDWLEKRGVKRVILLGHSLGSIRGAYYTRVTGDPRVASLVFLEPARVDFDFHRTLRAYWGQEADKALSWAQDMVRKGKGDAVDWVPSHHGARIRSTAESFLTYNGKDAQTTYAHMPHIDRPLLILEGEEAGKVTAFGFKPDRKGILKSADNSPLKDLVVIQGGDHFFSGRWDLLERALDDWLQRLRAFEANRP